MKYRIRERIQGDGTKLYDVQWKYGGFLSFLQSWENSYERGGLSRNRAPKTLTDCMELVAQFQQEDRDTEIKSTRYIGEGLAFIIYPRDNEKDKKPISPGIVRGV
jgi:hypothetical protein